jgi:hypothetical protein
MQWGNKMWKASGIKLPKENKSNNLIPICKLKIDIAREK